MLKNREVCVKLLSLSFATLITEVNYFIYIFKKLLKSHREINEAKEFARKCKYSRTYLRSWNGIFCFKIEFWTFIADCDNYNKNKLFKLTEELYIPNAKVNQCRLNVYKQKLALTFKMKLYMFTLYPLKWDSKSKPFSHEFLLISCLCTFIVCNFQLPIHFDENERARLTTPSDFSIRNSSIPNAGLGAWTTTRVPRFTVLGEYEGEEHQINGNQPYSWVVPCLYMSWLCCILYTVYMEIFVPFIYSPVFFSGRINIYNHYAFWANLSRSKIGYLVCQRPRITVYSVFILIHIKSFDPVIYRFVKENFRKRPHTCILF